MRKQHGKGYGMTLKKGRMTTKNDDENEMQNEQGV